MRKKYKRVRRKKLTDPEALTDRKRDNAFLREHRYTPNYHGEIEEYILYLVNMSAPSKSGFVVEQDSKRNTLMAPLLVNMAEKAMPFKLYPNEVSDFTLRAGRYIPKNFYPVMLNKKECLAWARRWKKAPQMKGEIKYF